MTTTPQESWYDSIVPKVKAHFLPRFEATYLDEGVEQPLFPDWNGFVVALEAAVARAKENIPITNIPKPGEPVAVYMKRRFQATRDRMEQVYVELQSWFTPPNLSHAEVNEIDLGQGMAVLMLLQILGEVPVISPQAKPALASKGKKKVK